MYGKVGSGPRMFSKHPRVNAQAWNPQVSLAGEKIVGVFLKAKWKSTG